MPSIDPTIFDHILFLVLVALLPWNARRRFKSFLKAVDGGEPSARTRLYRTIVTGKWAVAAMVAVAWIALGRSASSIGLIASITPLAIAGYALTALAIGALLVLARLAVHSEEGRRRTSNSVASVSAFIPRTASEKRWFDVMSVTAGIEEELIYRGFLFAYVAAWLPGRPAAFVILLAALVFGLAHIYQGTTGVVKAGTMGVLFGAVYWMTGSVWAPMVLHIVVDLSSGWITQQLATEGDLGHHPEPAAA